MQPDTFSFQFVQTELRRNLPFFGIASVVLVAGISSLVLAVLRSRERLLLWLGIFLVLYAVRLFVQNGLVHTALGIADGPVLLWTLCFTYVIRIPYALFARELIGPGWRKSISIWFWIQIGFALIAIPAFLLTRQFQWTELANQILMIGSTLLVLLHVVLQRGSSLALGKGLAWPLITCGLLVLLKNRGFEPAGVDVEPLGFVILLGGLGTAAAHLAPWQVISSTSSKPAKTHLLCWWPMFPGMACRRIGGLDAEGLFCGAARTVRDRRLRRGRPQRQTHPIRGCRASARIAASPKQAAGPAFERKRPLPRPLRTGYLLKHVGSL